MNKANLRLRNSKKGITPVIATIILIAGTLVLALVVGAYTFGLFGSNVKTIQLQSVTLYSGAIETTLASGVSYIALSVSNPGSSSYISAFTLNGLVASGNTSTVIEWSNTAGAKVTTALTSGTTNFNLANTGTNSLTLFPFSGGSGTPAVQTGQTYNYVITFANGQSVSGSIIAQ